MEPVVNGLETQFGDQVAFLQVDAGTREGQTVFRAYRLQGHPAYALIGLEGEVLWTGLGEQPGENLERELRAFLEIP